ncbi:hypothetical protein GQ43DRAFT_501137 [Delitschia confertaspora ATCC 74209]|uniref:Carbohydrate-binding module family 19 domain-containing protein n=1 Tax=Delitschia confertaspora ATCC 74209 TaxID=1513339 RepID=A0A9P4JQT3_9PLEO|nr:hypothetical protein GQ43DRAFT_501137 [Delitschia confertaspora ATCC 74209]
MILVNSILLGFSAITTLIHSVSPHMILASPIPYGLSTINNSPLEASGGDFPCKQRPGVYAITSVNNISFGSPQTLSFSGSAVHGGGSCQLSLSKDTEPTKESVFKVILSIEGGCPGVNGREDFEWMVPDVVRDGEYALAWTWFNHIGNREMYMNCAPITITNSPAKDSSAFDKLPDMAVANLAGLSTCKTREMFDYHFENPGDYVIRGGTGPWDALCGGNSPPGQSSSYPGVPTQVPHPSPTMSSSSMSSSSMSSSSMSSSSMSSSSMSSSSPVVSKSSSSLFDPTPTESPKATSSPGCNVCTPITVTQCRSEGQILCNGDFQYGICNHGFVVFQPVAPGTRCHEGRIAKAKYLVRRGRRSVGA